jgi:8-oxo-dGTP pyrophosphatase MutT (NUDIX family)
MFSLDEVSCRAGSSVGLPADQGGTEFPRKLPELSLRSGVVPFRLGANGRLEFLLIRRHGHEWWSLPKGRLTPGQTMAQAASEEAFEEAGIRGTIGAVPLGSFPYLKTERGLLKPPQFVELVLFALKVEVEAEDWPERGVRQRRWFDQEIAPQLVAPGPLRSLLRSHERRFLA